MLADFKEQMNQVVNQLAPAYRASTLTKLQGLWSSGVNTYKDLLLFAADGDDIDSRKTACWFLARLGDKQALPILAQCLLAEDLSLRAEAARCLGIIDGDEANEILLESLQLETDADVRMYVVHSLGLIGETNSFETLVQLLQAVEETPQVRAMAAESLAYLRDPRAINELLKVLADASAEVRYWAVFALGQIGDAEVIPVLEKMRGDMACPEGLGSVAEEVSEAIAGLQQNETGK